jgi:hypothetical protein
MPITHKSKPSLLRRYGFASGVGGVSTQENIMNRYIALTIILIPIFFTTPTMATPDKPSYVCVAEAAKGFSFNNGSWDNTKFNATAKYLLRPIDGTSFKDSASLSMAPADGKYSYGLVPFGDDYISKVCTVKGSFFRCVATGYSEGQFLFRTDTGRFIQTFLNAYWGKNDHPSDASVIERGSCERLTL